MLAAVNGSHDAYHAGAACLLSAATIIVGHSCDLLKTLVVPLPAALGTQPGVLDGNVKQCLSAIARGWAKLVHLIVGGILGGDIA
jgi:hypothetical protein